MFLSKRPNGIYYLYYHDCNGNRQKISTRSPNKSDALMTCPYNLWQMT